jgi:hypothetical protein
MISRALSRDGRFRIFLIELVNQLVNGQVFPQLIGRRTYAVVCVGVFSEARRAWACLLGFFAHG